MAEVSSHKPVMVDEVITFLKLKNGDRILDATVGCGGHAGAILEKVSPDGFLIGVDTDESTQLLAGKKLGKFNKMYKLVHANFRDIDKVLSELNIEKINGALFDLGLSSYQIGNGLRGFSFEREGFLDMRMDTSVGVRAYEIVNRCKKQDLERIIRDFGQERYFRRIAGSIVEQRKKQPIKSTLELANLIRRTVGRKYKSQRIHPATRTFQGLRIAVNEELASLEEALAKVANFLSAKARVCVISFHSLEDRIVKMRFRELGKSGVGNIVTKKPLGPTADEIRENPRSRSAKLRVFEKK